MHNCIHCNKALINTTEEMFCCFGCKTAYAIINKLNLQDFYNYCRNVYNANPPTVQPIVNQLDYLEYVKFNANENFHQTHLLVENIQCGSCIWLIEHTLKSQYNVINARVNLSTSRLVLHWHGGKEYITTLVELINKLGYRLIPFDPAMLEQEHKKQEHDLLKRLGVAFLAAANVMMLSVGVWAGNADHSIGIHSRGLLHHLAEIITVPVVLYSGMPFFRNALMALKAKRSAMDVPISIAIILTLIISILGTWQGYSYTYFDAVLSLISALLASRYLELRARNKARERARQLVLAQAHSATIWRGGEYILTNVKNIKPGDEMLVASGMVIPADGVIIEGASSIDNSLITGESVPTAVTVGHAVHAGTLNLGDPLKILVQNCGEDTILSEIIRLMENAEQGRAKYVAIADKVARWYMPFVLGASLGTFGTWLSVWQAPWQLALLNAVSLLIITCPCALAIAVPVVQVTSSARLFAQGIYLRTSDALEKLARAEIIIFDKTGTLTLGTPILTNKAEIAEQDFKLITGLAAASKHPLCKAICAQMENAQPLVNVQEKHGMGLSTNYQGRELYLGRMPENINSEDVYSEVWFKDGNNTPIRLTFKDTLREDAKAVVQHLKALGKHIIILSGDRPSVVANIADALEIDEAYAQIMPAEKCTFIKNLQQGDKNVLMIGDGLNDAAALKQANISISPITALDLPQSCADIVFTGKKLAAIPEAISIAIKSAKLVKENFTISFAYNIISVPLAFLGMVTPLIAAVAMSTSSLLVILNSLRMLRQKKG